MVLVYKCRNLAVVNNLLSCKASLSSYLLTPIPLLPSTFLFFFFFSSKQREWNFKLKLSGQDQVANGFHASSYGLFTYRCPFNMSCKAGLVALNSFSFCLSKRSIVVGESTGCPQILDFLSFGNKNVKFQLEDGHQKFNYIS